MGAAIAALVNQPGVFVPDDLPANLAGEINDIMPTEYGAIRGVTFSYASASQVLSQGQFAAAGTLNYLGGTLDISYGPTQLSLPFTSQFPQGTPNAQSESGTLLQIGNQLQLTLPIATTLDFFYIFDLVKITLSGQIVANATVPEPSAIVLAVLGALALFACRLRRRSTPTACILHDRIA